jgi:hypothetical protein
MRRITSQRPSPAMVVACIALVVALGGTSYAIQALPQNSVGSKQLKNNAVTSKKIKNGAVTTKKIKNGAVNSDKVKNGSLLSKDFKSGQLPAGPRGPQGPQGVPGAAGAAGPAGAPGSALAFAHVNADNTIDAARSENVVICCVSPFRQDPGAGVGIYCLDVTASRAPRNAVASIDNFAVGTVGVSLEQYQFHGPDCEQGTDALVTTTDLSTNALTDLPFYIVFN